LILDLSNSKEIDIPNLFPHIHDIVLLSLANCALDLAQVFELFSKVPFPNLRVLDLSRNKSSIDLQQHGQPAPLMFSLIVNDVKWGDGCLQGFFVFVFRNFASGIRLSISRISCSPKELRDAFSLFGAVESTKLASLTWNENELDQTVFNLLRKSSSLEYLSLSNCFSQTKPDAIRWLDEYLQSAPLLQVLCLSGSSSTCFGRYFSRVVSAFSHLPKIELLDIHGSYCGDQGIQALTEFITNVTTLQFVDFDGTHPSSSELYSQLLLSIGNPPGIQVSHPAEDINYLKWKNIVVSLIKKIFRPLAEIITS
jgi:hypothetical protein